jgi:hypothetical protein
MAQKQGEETDLIRVLIHSDQPRQRPLAHSS